MNTHLQFQVVLFWRGNITTHLCNCEKCFSLSNCSEKLGLNDTELCGLLACMPTQIRRHSTILCCVTWFWKCWGFKDAHDNSTFLKRSVSRSSGRLKTAHMSKVWISPTMRPSQYYVLILKRVVKKRFTNHLPILSSYSPCEIHERDCAETDLWGINSGIMSHLKTTRGLYEL